MNDREYAAGLYGGAARDAKDPLPSETNVPEPAIRYAKTSDGVGIAYYSLGEGPPLVYANPGSHLQEEWRHDEQRRWFEELLAYYRLIRFDLRGSGLSDRVDGYTPEQATLDIECVVRQERLNRFALFGVLSSAALAVLYACHHPEQVSHLVLWSPYASYRDFLETSPQLRAVRRTAAVDWRTYTEFLAEFLTGREDMSQALRFAAYLRTIWTREEYLTFMTAFAEMDLTEKLGQLAVPVLVVRRKGAAFPTEEVARRVATSAPQSRLAVLDGTAVSPFTGNTRDGLTAIREFLSEAPASRPGGLTEREIEILTLLANGASNEQIARDLSISTRTVERHIGNIYLKIGAHNRAEATAYAFRSRVVSAP